MANVVFSESVSLDSAEVFVLVANESGKSFIEDNLKSLFGKDVSKGVIEESFVWKNQKLQYGNGRRDQESYNSRCGKERIKYDGQS